MYVFMYFIMRNSRSLKEAFDFYTDLAALNLSSTEVEKNLKTSQNIAVPYLVICRLKKWLKEQILLTQKLGQEQNIDRVGTGEAL